MGLAIGIAVQLFVQFQLNLWNRGFFDALERRDAGAVWTQVTLLWPLALGAVIVSATLVGARMALHRNWRYWITTHLFGRWLVNGRYYQLNLIAGDHRNPEQRIAEDVRIAVEAPVDLIIGLVTALSTAVMFLGVLWSIGGGITLFGVRIPGALVVAALVWASITTTTMVLVARRMVHVIDKKNQAEADFRYELTRVREHGESIALLGGEIEERGTLTGRLGDAIAAFRHFGREIVKTNMVSSANMVLAPNIPALVCAPQYLAGTMSLGEVMQAVTAFVAVQAAMNWVVDNYPRIADMHASSHRVATLLRSIDALELAESPETAGRIRVVESADGPALNLDKVHVALDDGTAVIGETEVAIAPGEWVLLVGESGTGKSTLVRAIAGLWPWGDGEIRIARGAKLFFMPQRPYVPTGTLKRAVSYPDPAEDVPDDIAVEALRAANLGHVAERLHEIAPWERTLSGGEQQRLAFARLFIQKPDVVIMDEATSALDLDMQAVMLDQVRARLPRSAVVSVGHRPELEAFHERRVEFARRKDGARVVSDAPISARRSPIERISTWLKGRRVA